MLDQPKFARATKTGYEYGVVVINDEGKERTKKYKVLGEAKTLNDAMRKAGMSQLQGSRCSGKH